MNKIKIIIPFLAGIIVGQLGLSHGSEQCKEEIEKTLNNLLPSSVSSDMSIHIKALEKLRIGEPDKAIELLENTLDIDLATLASFEKSITQEKAGDIIRQLKMAKEYRRKYPQHKVNKLLDESVSKALELAK